MHKSHIVSFIGSTQRPSQTRKLAELIGAATVAQTDFTSSVFDLQDIGSTIGSYARAGLAPAAEKVLREIETADALIMGTPTHKGAYSGLFKHVIDLLDPLALVGKPVAIVATGGGPRHALMVEHQLRPLFGFFCALTMPTAVYACAQDFDAHGAMDDMLGARVKSLSTELRGAVLASAPGRPPHSATAPATIHAAAR